MPHTGVGWRMDTLIIIGDDSCGALLLHACGAHFSMEIHKYGNTDPYSVFFPASIRII